MSNDSRIYFQLRNFNKDIEVWVDNDRNASKVMSVSTFQEALRTCNAVDDFTIDMFSTAIGISSPSVQVQNFDCVCKRLGVQQHATT
jgi:hypothetical protein